MQGHSVTHLLLKYRKELQTHKKWQEGEGRYQDGGAGAPPLVHSGQGNGILKSIGKTLPVLGK